MASFTTIGAGGNVQDKTYLREIEDAIWQRYAVAGVAPPSWARAGGSTAAGDNIQTASFWAVRQQAITDLIAAAHNPFAVAGSYGTPPTTVPSIQNSTVITTYDAATTFWSAVTGNAGGPRRCRSTPGTASAYGNTQAGDIIGPWLIQDLQMALRYLRYTIAADVAAGTQGWEAGTPSDFQIGNYVSNSTWWAGYFDRAISSHDSSLKPYMATPPWPYLLAARNRLNTQIVSTFPTQYNYQARSYRRCTDVAVTHAAGLVAPRRIHLAGIYTNLVPATEDGYACIYTAGSPRVTLGRYGLVGTSAWHTAADYTIPMNTVIPRTFEYAPRPGSTTDVVDVGCLVGTDELVALTEWQWNYA